MPGDIRWLIRKHKYALFKKQTRVDIVKTIITESWNKYLEKFNTKNRDIYYYEEYVKLYEDKTSKALCAVCYDDEYVLMMPYIRKEIDGYYDFE